MASVAELAAIHAAQQADGKKLTVRELKNISDLVKEQRFLETQIADEEAKLKSLKEKLVDVQGNRLIAALDEAGTSVFKTDDGTRVEVVNKYSGKITDENREACFAWLEENGHEEIMKCEVVLPFKKGQLEEANKALAILQKAKYKPILDRSVHAATLAAFIREQMESDEEEKPEFPAQTFNANVYRYTKITTKDNQ